MSISDLMQAMSEAGAPMEAIIIAVRAVEAKDKELADKRAVERDRKRRQRAKDTDGTVTGQSRDTDGTVPTETSLSRPPNENNSNPPTHTHPDRTPTRKGTRLPDDWEPKALPKEAAEMVACWQPGVIERELAKFRDWAASAPGEKGRKLDWDAAWRNWLRNVDDRAPRNEHRNGSKPSTGKVDGFTAVLREVARREHEPPGALNG